MFGLSAGGASHMHACMHAAWAGGAAHRPQTAVAAACSPLESWRRRGGAALLAGPEFRDLVACIQSGVVPGSGPDAGMRFLRERGTALHDQWVTFISLVSISVNAVVHHLAFLLDEGWHLAISTVLP